MKKSIKITDKINPIFYSFWTNDKPNAVLKGGRSSMKSSAISLKLVMDFMQDPQANVVCLRKVGKYLSTSVYEQIKWAIKELNLQHQFFFGKSPLIIKHKATDTAFYFYGCDDPMKIKSAKMSTGYVHALWFEELAEFDGVEDIDIVSDTFIRQDLGDKEVKLYYSYNPPRNPYAWINEWVETKKYDDDYFVHHSTYHDDIKGFLSTQMVRKIEQYKINDYDYWNWMYNGQVIGLGNMVYNINQFKWIPEIPSDDDVMYIDIAIDGGHMESATTFTAYGFTKRQNVILLDTYYYSPANKSIKKAPSQLAEDYKEWRDKIYNTYNKNIHTETIDSAEGALRNQLYYDHSIRLQPVAKLKKIDMIDFVQNLLAEDRFRILENPNNKIFYEEHKKYMWDENTVHTPEPKVIKVDDHTCDAFQYYVVANRRKLGLKV